jgi:glycosyltransferase involved in cell wall biosynthesis
MKIVLDLQACQASNRERNIGRYSLALAQAIARQGGSDHDIHVILSNAFPETVAPLRQQFADLLPPEKIRVFDIPTGIGKYDPAAIWRGRAAIQVWQRYLAHLKPDVVHIASLFEGWGDDAVAAIPPLGSNRFDTAVTLYDLIPYLHQEHYLSMPFFREWYLRKIQSLKSAEMLLTFSESSRQQALEHLHLPAQRVVNISAAVAPDFKPVTLTPEAEASLLQRFRLNRPFLMYSGGIDYRKNLEGLVEAMSRLPAILRGGYQLTIVGRIRASDQQRLDEKARQCGLQADTLVCTGAVNDADLLGLYNCASLFVSPVLHEGFGLPVLEAMSCGLPVLGANCNSIPEIIGREEALFDPDNIDQMAQKITQVLTDDGFRLNLREHGLRQAKRFSWDNSAEKVLEAFAGQHLHGDDALLQQIISLASLPSEHLSPLALEAPKTGSRYPSPDSELHNKPLRGRPALRLAYVSPLPAPVLMAGQDTGQSNKATLGYSAQLVQELARFYQIELVTDQPEIEPAILPASFTVRSLAWFRQHAGVYDRIVYHVANHHSFAPVLELMAEHSGIVILHDFFLGEVLKGNDPLSRPFPGYRQALYHSHGYPALQSQQESKQDTGTDNALLQYPCNRLVLDRANGLIIHSNRFRHLAEQWYAETLPCNWQMLPRMQAVPLHHEARHLRWAVRNSLQLTEHDTLICAFGMETPNAHSQTLLETWLVSSLASNPRYHLVFVGAETTGHYGQELKRLIADCPCSKQIHLTGAIDSEDYAGWRRAADMGILLHTDENHLALENTLACLAYSVPSLIASAGTGSFVESLPEDICFKLAVDFTPGQLLDALEQLNNEPETRRLLALRAVRYVQERHHPAQVAEQYHRAIEALALQDAPSSYRSLLEALSGIVSPYPPDEADVLAVTASTAENHRPPGPRQMFVDVTTLMQVSQPGGKASSVHEEVEAILRQLLREPPAHYRLEPVYNDGELYRYARTLTLEQLGIPGGGLEDLPLEVRPGDVFLGLDFLPETVAHQYLPLLQLKNRGLSMHFVVYDLLPLQQPDSFSPPERAAFHAWLRTVSLLADNLVCTSHALSDTVLEWLKAQSMPLQPLPRVSYFHLGSSLHGLALQEGNNSAPAQGNKLLGKLFGKKADDELLATLDQHPTFLMLGEIAPHRGHLQTLFAFDLLWGSSSSASESCLLMIGSRSETGESIARQIKRHPQFGKKLFWLEEASSSLQDACCRRATALIAGAEAAGCGLELVQAAHYRLPLIVRRIPAFEEVAAEYATYFDGTNPSDLAATLRDWLAFRNEDGVPDSSNIRRVNWMQSTQQLLSAVLGRSTYRQVPVKGLPTLEIESEGIVQDRVLGSTQAFL